MIFQQVFCILRPFFIVFYCLTVVLFLFIIEAINSRMLTSPEVMSLRGMTWTKGAMPPRFGYFVKGQSNSR